MTKPLLFILLLLPLHCLPQGYPSDVEKVLVKAGQNRAELEKAIIHYERINDPLKLKAAFFLISNMDIHHSESYYWVDGKNKKVEYNELAYPDFQSAASAFELIKAKTPGIHPVPFKADDIAAIKGDYLIHNIDNAFKTWRSGIASHISFANFCEYILPYRIDIEPFQDWRAVYGQKFSWLGEKSRTKDFNAVLSYVSADERSWFKDTWGTAGRSEPLPRLGAMQLLLRKNGLCADIANLEVFTFRSQGIPVALNIIPYWATSTDSHFLNTVFDDKMNPIQFDVTRTPAVNNKLLREPSKVIRVTYSKQRGVLSSFQNEQDIPAGFMRTPNYIDVTDHFWETTNVSCALFPDNKKTNIVYACVFNGLTWNPTWWGRCENEKVVFSKMSKGAVYLPVYFVNGKTKTAGYPIALGYHQQVVLKPDLNDKRSITVNEEDRHLVFQPGKKYKLFYWDNNWISCGIQVATLGDKHMVFNNVPKNALLLLLPDYTQGKERPFTIANDGNRLWW